MIQSTKNLILVDFYSTQDTMICYSLVTCSSTMKIDAVNFHHLIAVTYPENTCFDTNKGYKLIYDQNLWLKLKDIIFMYLIIRSLYLVVDTFYCYDLV